MMQSKKIVIAGYTNTKFITKEQGNKHNIKGHCKEQQRDNTCNL